MKWIAAASLAAFAAACSYYGAPGADPGYAANAEGKRQCFYAPNVVGFREGENGNILVNTNARDYYELRPLGGGDPPA